MSGKRAHPVNQENLTISNMKIQTNRVRCVPSHKRLSTGAELLFLERVPTPDSPIPIAGHLN